jgi:hypothetical protein
MAEVKKVEKTAESGGIQNVASGEAYPKGDREVGKTLAETRALRAKEDADNEEAQAKNRAEVAERDAKAKPGEGKPSKRTEREMAVSKK